MLIPALKEVHIAFLGFYILFYFPTMGITPLIIKHLDLPNQIKNVSCNGLWLWVYIYIYIYGKIYGSKSARQICVFVMCTQDDATWHNLDH